MGEPASTAAPNDLKDPQEKHAVRENHDADLQPDDQGPSTLTDNNHSQSSTDADSDPEKGDIEKADNGAPAVQDQHTDPNLVDWAGPDDPETPTNWASGRLSLPPCSPPGSPSLWWSSIRTTSSLPPLSSPSFF
ncbi:MAG: hypothetical protein L6R42_005862 [Xanthoria sp. 1 TBL-2021]|nr:MAG: hypothetical protein L6R42_005862 [Xanthoria sp. 1 TBL-2021]